MNVDEYLYVCHFSNGTIKVGRSCNPNGRIRTHLDRVACVGIELVETLISACCGDALPSEFALIQKCRNKATKCLQNEWFEGLDFKEVVGWANEYASTQFVGWPKKIKKSAAGQKISA